MKCIWFGKLWNIILVDQKLADTGDQTKNEFETLETKVEESQIKEKIDK